jgi:hypothetical protein
VHACLEGLARAAIQNIQLHHGDFRLQNRC